MTPVNGTAAKQPTTKLSPVDALRLVRRVLGDRSIGPAARIATAAVILSADNETGLAWASYRSLRAEFGLSSDSVAGALRSDGGAAMGRYLCVASRGQQGAVQYRVLLGELDEPAHRLPERSGEQSALRNPPPSAPILPVERSGRQRQTSPLNWPLKLAPTSSSVRSGVRSVSHDGAEAIYQAYPRRVGKGAALKAIVRAVKGIAARKDAPADPAGWLLERVKAYAAARRGQDQQYTPHPATWFNQERYDDDPTEWSARPDADRSPARISAPEGKYANVGRKVYVGSRPSIATNDKYENL